MDASQHLVLEDHIRNLYGTPHARVCGYFIFWFSGLSGQSGRWPEHATEKTNGNLSMLLEIAMQP